MKRQYEEIMLKLARCCYKQLFHIGVDMHESSLKNEIDPGSELLTRE